MLEKEPAMTDSRVRPQDPAKAIRSNLEGLGYGW